MKERDNKNLITKGVVALLCVFFIVGFIWGFNKVMHMEGTMAPAMITPSASEIPESADEALKYVNTAIEAAFEKKPAFSKNDSFSINNVTTDGSDELLGTLNYIRKDFENGLEDSLGGIETDFGEDFSNELLLPEISVADISEYVGAHIYYKCPECDKTSDEPQDSCSACDSSAPFEKMYRTHVYYQCPSCDEESEVPLDKCEKCGYEHPYNMKYRDEYTISFVLAGTGDELLNNPSFQKCFGLRTKEDITALYKDELNGKVKINAVKSACNYALVEVKVNRFTDEITSLEYIKNTDVDVDSEFTGGYSLLGNVSIKCNVIEKNKFNFTWPALELSAEEMSIAPSDSDNLVATLICTDPTAMNITWQSSDESIVKVDDEGYMKTTKKTGKATVTASFEFNGKQYSDSCEVTVKTSVEELNVSKRKLTLEKGDTYTLTAKVSPKKSTVQTVKWYSSDEAVAQVDAQGKVTAVSHGTADIYALSDDGYYKSTCEVTVE